MDNFHIEHPKKVGFQKTCINLHISFLTIPSAIKSENLKSYEKSQLARKVICVHC